MRLTVSQIDSLRLKELVMYNPIPTSRRRTNSRFLNPRTTSLKLKACFRIPGRLQHNGRPQGIQVSSLINLFLSAMDLSADSEKRFLQDPWILVTDRSVMDSWFSSLGRLTHRVFLRDKGNLLANSQPSQRNALWLTACNRIPTDSFYRTDFHANGRRFDHLAEIFCPVGVGSWFTGWNLRARATHNLWSAAGLSGGCWITSYSTNLFLLSFPYQLLLRKDKEKERFVNLQSTCKWSTVEGKDLSASTELLCISTIL